MIRAEEDLVAAAKQCNDMRYDPETKRLCYPSRGHKFKHLRGRYQDVAVRLGEVRLQLARISAQPLAATRAVAAVEAFTQVSKSPGNVE